MSLIIQDCILAWRNGLVLVTGITLVVIIGLYWIFPLLLPCWITSVIRATPATCYRAACSPDPMLTRSICTACTRLASKPDV